MNHDLILGETVDACCNSIATYYWKHLKTGETKIKIVLNNEKCPECGKYLFTDRDYPHILEHEITECITINILYEDGLFHQFNPDNFNNVFSPKHIKRKVHKCKGCTINRVFG